MGDDIKNNFEELCSASLLEGILGPAFSELNFAFAFSPTVLSANSLTDALKFACWSLPFPFHPVVPPIRHVSAKFAILATFPACVCPCPALEPRVGPRLLFSLNGRRLPLPAAACRRPGWPGWPGGGDTASTWYPLRCRCAFTNSRKFALGGPMPRWSAPI